MALDLLFADEMIVTSGSGEIRSKAEELEQLTNVDPDFVLTRPFTTQQVFPGRSAIGQRLKFGTSADSPRPWMTVVGVVGDYKQDSLQERPGPMTFTSTDSSCGEQALLIAPMAPRNIARDIARDNTKYRSST